MVNCVHHIPGRARFKLDALRHDDDLCQSIETKLQALHGITSVEVSRRSGSIIVHYCTRRGQIDEVADHIRAHHPVAAESLTMGDGAAGLDGFAYPMRETGAEFGRAVRTAMGKAVLNIMITRVMGTG